MQGATKSARRANESDSLLRIVVSSIEASSWFHRCNNHVPHASEGKNALCRMDLEQEAD